MTSRCPKCGKNNYGDVKKCSFCGSALTFIPGQEVEEITEEVIQEKMDKMKVERLRNPMMMGIGGIVGVIGFVLMVILFLVMMFFVYSPTGVDPSYEMGSWNYNVNGGEQMIFGEITRVTEFTDTNWGTGGNHGYQEMTAYEISGDGDDNRVLAFREGKVNIEPDVWVYSDEDLGDKGDRVLIRVESKSNEFGEERAFSPGHAAWGGKGWRSGWPWILPGFMILVGGIIVFLIGIIGKADRSMERLLAEDEELRRQQIMLKEAARKQMEARKKQNQWSQDGQGSYPVQNPADQPMQPQEQAPVQQQQIQPQQQPLQPQAQAPVQQQQIQPQQQPLQPQAQAPVQQQQMQPQAQAPPVQPPQYQPPA